MRFWKIAVPAGLVAASLFAFPAPAFAQGKKSDEKKPSEEGKKAPEGEKKKGKKAREESSKRSFDLDAHGLLGAPAKGSPDFHDFSYSAVEGKKRVKKKAWIKIDSGTTALADRAVQLDAFKEGDTVMIFGKPMELESGGKGMVTGKIYRIQASRVLIGGKNVKVNEGYGDPKDKGFMWCETSVEKSGKALTVTYEGSSHNVSLDKGAAMLLRGEADLKKELRKGALIAVQGSALNEKPEGEKEERPTFHASQLILLEKRFPQWYEGAIFP